MRLLEPAAQIWMKIEAYYQRQKCRPMTLVSGNMFMQIFEGFPWSGRQTTFGVVDDSNFWRFRWLRLRKLQRHGKQYYMTTCCLLSAGNWLQNEWPWVAIACQNPFSASDSWIRAFECQKIIPHNAIPRCSVHCTISEPAIGRLAQLTRCFSAVAELLVHIAGQCCRRYIGLARLAARNTFPL